MSSVKLAERKNEVHNIMSTCLTIVLVVAVIMVIFELSVSVFGGKLSAHALIAYASWIGIALAGKVFVKRTQNGLRIRWCDYLLVCICAVVNFVIWFSYPVNVILSVLCFIASAVAYWKQNSRLKNE